MREDRELKEGEEVSLACDRERERERGIKSDYLCGEGKRLRRRKRERMEEWMNVWSQAGYTRRGSTSRLQTELD